VCVELEDGSTMREVENRKQLLPLPFQRHETSIKGLLTNALPPMHQRSNKGTF